MASNHISHFEPALLSAFFPRHLDWVAMEELFSHPWSARFFSKLHAISVDRFGSNPQANRQALRTMAKRLAQGRVIGIFPEGGIRTGTSSILEGAPMKPGLALLSMLTQAPIIPCVVLGTDLLYEPAQWFRRPRIFIIIGKALVPPRNKTTAPEKRSSVFQQQINAVFPALQQELCNRFELKKNDLPKTAQERKNHD